MSSTENETQKSSSWSLMSLLAGVVLGVFIFMMYTKISGGGETLAGLKDILAAVPEKDKVDGSKYILNTVTFAARLQDEIASYDRKTAISKETQDKISGALSTESSNSMAKISMNAKLMNCLDDTIKGVTFDLIPIVSSLLNGQNASSITNLTLTGHGIYVAFGRYPDTIPNDFPADITSQMYDMHYKSKRTAYLNYVKKIQSSGQPDPQFIFLNQNGGSDPNYRLADNFGKVCPTICPN